MLARMNASFLRWSALVALFAFSPSCERAGSTNPPVDDADDGVAVAQASGESPSSLDVDDETSVVDPHVNAPYAAQTNVDGWVERFEREGREVHDHRERIVDALRLEEGMRVADLGAGTGLFTFAMAHVVGPTGRVFAVDVQDHFVEHLQARARQDGATNVTAVVADQRSPNLPDGSVDLAFFCDAYHHVEYPRTYLANLRKALAPGGRLVVVDYARIEGKSPKWLLEHIRASPEVFRREIEQAGFRFVREETFLTENFFYEFIVDEG